MDFSYDIVNFLSARAHIYSPGRTLILSMDLFYAIVDFLCRLVQIKADFYSESALLLCDSEHFLQAQTFILIQWTFSQQERTFTHQGGLLLRELTFIMPQQTFMCKSTDLYYAIAYFYYVSPDCFTLRQTFILRADFFQDIVDFFSARVDFY